MRVKGASRTDAGVHAKGQVVALSTDSNLPAETFTKAINYYLADGIAVLGTFDVPDDFDPRRGALSRVYRYVILNRKPPSPLESNRAYHFERDLDVETMAKATQSLVGTHNMWAFTSPSLADVQKTVRTVHQAHTVRKGDKVFFEIEANSFLPQQIRRTVGALLQVGIGKLSSADFSLMAEFGPPGAAGPVVPPWGLYLMRVKYPEGYPS